MTISRKSTLTALAVLTLFVFAAASCGKPAGETSVRKRAPLRLSSDDRRLVREKTAALTEPVTLKLYTGSLIEKHSPETRELLKLMSSMASRIKVEEVSLTNPEDIKHLDTDHGPVTVFEGSAGNRITYYGFPDKLELEPFLDSLLITSGQMESLAPSTVSYLEKLDADVKIQVFVTPI